MTLTTTHTVIAALQDGKKICKTELTGNLGASGGIYTYPSLAKVTDVLSIHACGRKTKLAHSWNAVVTSGNEVVIYPLVIENAGLSGTAWAALTSADSASGHVFLYTLGV